MLYGLFYDDIIGQLKIIKMRITSKVRSKEQWGGKRSVNASHHSIKERSSKAENDIEVMRLKFSSVFTLEGIENILATNLIKLSKIVYFLLPFIVYIIGLMVKMDGNIFIKIQTKS